MDNRNKKDAAQEKREKEKTAKAMDERMAQEEEELTMLKDCASLLAQAKLQAEKEKKANSSLCMIPQCLTISDDPPSAAAADPLSH